MSDCVLWQYLEDLPGQCAPWCEWESHIGNWPGFSGFQKRYLQLTKDRATAVECRTNCSFGCPRKVVEHSPDDIVAVCPEQEGKPYSLNAKDILVYSIKRNTFHKDLCSNLGIEFRESKLDDCRRTWRLGDYIPTAGYIFPVFISFQEEPGDLVEVVRTLCLYHSNPFALIIPTRRCVTSKTENLLNLHGSLLISLNEEKFFSDEGRLQTVRPASDVFAKFQVSNSISAHEIKFATPEGTKWSDIQIRFLESPTVYVKKQDIYVSTSIRVTVGNVDRVISCEEAGMAKKNNKMPKDQWILLYAFAKQRGRLDWSSDHPPQQVVKQKQELSKSLKKFFGLDGNPIEDWDKEEQCYRCRFRILPEGDEGY